MLGMPGRDGEEVVVAARPADKLVHLDRQAQLCALTLAVARDTAEVPAYKRPTRVMVLHEPLPRTLTGKVRRTALAQVVSSALTPTAGAAA